MRYNQCVTNDITYSWIVHIEDHLFKYHVIWTQVLPDNHFIENKLNRNYE